MINENFKTHAAVKIFYHSEVDKFAKSSGPHNPSRRCLAWILHLTHFINCPRRHCKSMFEHSSLRAFIRSCPDKHNFTANACSFLSRSVTRRLIAILPSKFHRWCPLPWPSGICRCRLPSLIKYSVFAGQLRAMTPKQVSMK